MSQEKPLTGSTTEIFKKQAHKEDYSWTHMNIWDCPYYLYCKQVKTQHFWLRSGDGCIRGLRAYFRGLEFTSDSTWERFLTVKECWGHPGIMKYEEPILYNRLLVGEQWFECLDDAVHDIEQFTGDVDFTEFCNDIFGDV